MKQIISIKALLLTVLMTMMVGNVWAATKYTATFFVNGNVFWTYSCEANQYITFPSTAPADINGKCFRGWATSPINGTTEEVPTMVSIANMGTSNVSFYAVFANKTASDVTTTIADEMTRASIGVTTNGYLSWSGKTFTSCAVYAGKTSGGNGQNFALNATDNIGIVLTRSGGKAKKVEIEWFTTQDGKIDIYGSNTAYQSTSDLYDESKRGTLINSIGSSTQTLTFDDNYAYIGLRAQNGSVYLKKIVISWEDKSNGTYSGYCTDITDITSTVTLSSSCTDGTKYYGTYSNGSAFVVPDDLTVSAVGVDSDGKLVVTDYTTGDVVKANTGVMVSSNTSGDHTVTLSSAEGTEINGNLLMASGDGGITAEQMVGAKSGCKFYRLTMHNTTEIGFWWGAESGAAFALGANKAYLAVPETTKVREGFRFFDNENSGIAEIEDRKVGNEIIYDLQGRRVSKATKGVYIVNGRIVTK